MRVKMPSGFVNYDDISYKNLSGEKDPSGSLSPFTFLCVAIAVSFFGLLMLYSASFDKAISEGLGHYHYFIRQLLVSFFAVASGLALSSVSLKVLSKCWYVLFPVSVIASAVSLIPGFSVEGSVVVDDLVLIQPGLLCAFTSIFVSSDFIPEPEAYGEGNGLAFFLSFVSLALLMVLAALSSGLAFYVLIAFIVLSVLKARKLPLWACILFMLLSFGGALALYFLSPVSAIYPSQEGQASLCLKAVRDGGTAGVGLGQGLYKLEGLSCPESCQIFAVIVEETGIIGYLFFLMLLAVLVVIGFRSSGRARRRCDSSLEALTLALTAYIAVPAILNPLEVLSLLPLPGLQLPFAGYGLQGQYLTVLATCLLYRLVYVAGRSSGDGKR